MFPALGAADEALFRAINEGWNTPLLDHAMMFISSKYTWLLLGIAALAGALLTKRRRVLSMCLLIGMTLGASDFVTYQLLKPAFARERPCRQFHDIHLVPQWCGGDYGLPSNHAANGMAVTVVLALGGQPLLAGLGLALTLLTGFSRVYLGVHFPGDVVAGFIVGAVVGAACHFLWKALTQRLPPSITGRRSNPVAD